MYPDINKLRVQGEKRIPKRRSFVKNVLVEVLLS